MLLPSILESVKGWDKQAAKEAAAPPAYDPKTHFIEVGRSPYFHDLTLLRHVFRVVCDSYMADVAKAVNVDMYMYTPSASSPMGPGSDSKPVHFDFGGVSTFLTDSAQFGFEPLLLNGLDRAYSYLPSLRGEDADYRHLNQFYHCEIELRGGREDAIKVAEGLVKTLSAGFLECRNIIANISANPQASLDALQRIVDCEALPRITFDEACKLLTEKGYGDLVNETEKGRDISSKGELVLMELLGYQTPVWMTDYDRDRVAFYQKPNPDNPSSVLNADLLFPPIVVGSFGGEIVGLGQRQDSRQEIVESLDAQKVALEPYEWYVRLRDDPRYQITSGFGLGIERYITWSIGRNNIRDAILYPRIKGEIATP